MATLTIKLPSQREQTDFNLRRWQELAVDTELAKIEGRVETDRYGHVIISPPPAANHGSFQARMAVLLDRLMKSTGRVLTECPISTADGVRAADVAWASSNCLEELGNRVCFRRSPEICVEVLSPGNSDAEIQEKMALCETTGAMKFFVGSQSVRASTLCPDFPAQVSLRQSIPRAFSWKNYECQKELWRLLAIRHSSFGIHAHPGHSRLPSARQPLHTPQ